ncbi:PKD domain-containing protein [Schleiferiaceae bacterium]|jgi:hypothetical protein|nr:PKD domain-containing protein [Schleiferiaceae bacterium]
MKKLYSLVFTLSSIWAFGQGTPGIVNGSVVDSSGNGVSNYPVHIIDSNSNGGINSSVLLTDVNGMFNDTLQLGTVGSLTISVFDSCSNTHQSVSIPYSPNAIGGVIVVTQSFVICGSNSGSGGGNGGGGSGGGGSGGGGSGGGTTLGCKAAYMFDTVLTTLGQVVVYNTSTVDSTYSQSGSVSYLWDFGDGTSDTGQFPTHVYTQAGSYALCVTVIAVGQNANMVSTCTDTYCDTLTVDSTGAISYKNVNVVLNVYSPEQMNVEENNNQYVSLYPNPSHGSALLELEHESLILIYSMEGKLIREWKSEGGKELLPVLAPGTYFVRIKDQSSSQILRWLISH